MRIRFGYSADADDAFMAWALAEGRVDRWTVFVAADWVVAEDAVPLFAAGRAPLEVRLIDAAWQPCGRDVLLTGRVAP